MKTNDYLLITATVGYSYLFYNQNAGINFLIFNLLLIYILIYRNKTLIKNKKWIATSVLCLISSVGIFLNSSSLAIIANIFSLLILSAISFNPVTSTLFSFLFGIYSVASSIVFTIIDAISRNQKSNEVAQQDSQKSFKLLATVIVLILAVIFFFLYQTSNPLFAENTKWINLDFISFSWLIFTIGGFYLVYGLFYHKTIPVIEKWENGLSLQNVLISDNNNKLEAERFAGVLLFVLLNLMLLVLNIGDVRTLYFKGGLPKGISHSDFVHHGVGMIIFSIILATSLIMFLFRKNFEAVKNSNLLKSLIYIWIFQNLMMLSSTAFRNQIYIHEFNLTYKRVGVYAWLMLAAVGLIIAANKIRKEKSNWYLIRSNFSVWIITLVSGSLINWDVCITQYNISNKPLKEVDFYYLFSLSDGNLPELIEITKSDEFKKINHALKNFTENRYDSYYYQDYLSLLREKYQHYLIDYTNDWQSWDLRDQRITNSIIENKSFLINL